MNVDIAEAESDRHYAVITGYLARNMPEMPSFIGKPTPAQEYELCRPHAKILAKRAKGKSVYAEHLEKEGNLGEIVRAWVTDDNDFHAQVVVDGSTLAGADVIKAVLASAKSEHNPYGRQFVNFSLGHRGLNTEEVSLVEEGARAGSEIYDVKLVNEKELNELKQQHYKEDDDDTEEYTLDPSLENLYIAATIRRADNMSTPPQQQAQQPQQKDTGAVPPQFQKQQRNVPQEGNSALEQKVAQLEKMIANIHSKQDPNGSQAGPADPEFNSKLEQYNKQQELPGGLGGAGINLGSEPDDHIKTLAAALDDGKNILTKENRAIVANTLKELINLRNEKQQQLQQLAFEKKQKEEELAAARAENAKHHGDKKQQRSQAAKMFAEIMKLGNPNASNEIRQAIDGAEADFANGDHEQGMMKALPPLIRASARFARLQEMQNEQAHGSAQQHDEEDDTNMSFSDLYNKSIKASKKRSNTEMARGSGERYSGGSSSSASSSMPSTSSFLDDLFKQAEKINDGKMRKEDYMSVDSNKRNR